jgi:hypothetical protein
MPQLKHLTPEQVQRYKEDGFLLLRAHEIWKPEELQDFIRYANEIDSWPETPGKWMQYFEKSKKDGSRILQRLENFFEYHEGMNALFNGPRFLELLSDLTDGEETVLFKEKINYKYPGAQGFNPHQDAQAGWGIYGHTFHISFLCTIDEATTENGCLELVRGKHKDGLLGPEWQEISQDVVDKLTWEPAPTKPGDIVFFDSFVPHRSAPNMSEKPRRVLYGTYNLAKQGDFRKQYYEDKRKSFPPDIERDPTKEYVYKI